jgi:hypothetical protein
MAHTVGCLPNSQSSSLTESQFCVPEIMSSLISSNYCCAHFSRGLSVQPPYSERLNLFLLYF